MNLEISSNLLTRDRLMIFTSTPLCLEVKRRMLPFLLLAFVMLEATAGFAVAQTPQEEEAARRRAAMEKVQLQLQRQLQVEMQQQRNAVRQLPVEQFDRLVFQQDQSPSAARERLETSLSNEVAELDRACTLSLAQKHKLRLMGRGDIKRFFDRCETVKEKFLALGQVDGALNEDLNSLQITLRCGLIDGDSLLHKALPKALTGEQLAQCNAMLRERSQSHHAAAIDRTVTILEQGSRFSDAGRQKLIALLKKETRPSRITSPYDFYYILGQIRRLPEEKVKPLLNDAQWLRLTMYQNNLQRIEPMLRKAGCFPGEEDEDEILGAPAPKK